MTTVATTNLETARKRSDQPTHDVLTGALEALDQIILGKKHKNRLAAACLLANGHLLIEDLPGVGKTTLAHSLASVFGLNYQRVQFTSDMLPADITGVSIFQKETQKFTLHRGPIFSQLILADEINRATPKTQSALLEAMEERQVSIDGKSYALPTPFFVVATQNPTEQVGTYDLPESQLDRFMMRISLGYPDRQHERQLLTGQDRRELLSSQPASMSIEQFSVLQQRASEVHIAPALLDYLQDLVEFSRSDQQLVNGISPRAALVLMKAAKAWAFIHHHEGVRPQDLQSVLAAVVDHRVRFKLGTKTEANDTVSAYLLRSVAIP